MVHSYIHMLNIGLGVIQQGIVGSRGHLVPVEIPLPPNILSTPSWVIDGCNYTDRIIDIDKIVREQKIIRLLSLIWGRQFVML